MPSGKRGALAVVGIIAGFLTLVFVSQMFRYMTPAMLGDQLSLGMWSIYVVLTYTGATVTLWSFIPRVSVAKYLGGAGGAVAAALVLIALYLFATGEIVSGLMLLIITGGQAVVAGIVYGIARSRESDPDSTPETDPEIEPERTLEREASPEPVTTHAEPESTTETVSKSPDNADTNLKSAPGSGREIDWRTGGQIFAGGVLILIGIPITIESPVGVPILLAGLALIPRVRSWSMRTLGRSTAD